MGLFERVGNVIRANMHDLVEGMEDPVLMLGQIIRDLEAGINEMRAQVKNCHAAVALTKAHLGQARAVEEKWQNGATLAVQAGKDDLARKALIEKRTATARLVSLGEQLANEEALVEQAQTHLTAAENRLPELRAKHTSLSTEQNTAQAAAKLQQAKTAGRTVSSAPGAATSGESKAERLMNGIDRLEERLSEKVIALEARAQAEVDFATPDLEAQIDRLTQESDIDTALEKLRAKVKKQKSKKNKGK